MFTFIAHWQVHAVYNRMNNYYVGDIWLVCFNSNPPQPWFLCIIGPHLRLHQAKCIDTEASAKMQFPTMLGLKNPPVFFYTGETRMAQTQIHQSICWWHLTQDTARVEVVVVCLFYFKISVCSQISRFLSERRICWPAKAAITKLFCLSHFTPADCIISPPVYVFIRVVIIAGFLYRVLTSCLPFLVFHSECHLRPSGFQTCQYIKCKCKRLFFFFFQSFFAAAFTSISHPFWRM